MSRSQHPFGSFFGLCSFLITLLKHIWTTQPCVDSQCFNHNWNIPCAHIVWGSRIPTCQPQGFCHRSVSAGPVFFVYPRHQPRQKDCNYWVFPVALATYINICSTTKAPLAKNYLRLIIIHYQNITTNFKEVNLFHRGKNFFWAELELPTHITLQALPLPCPWQITVR